MDQEIDTRSGSNWGLVALVALASLMVSQTQLIPSVAMQNIREEFGLSAAEIGFMSAASGFRLSLIGIVIALLADRYGRRHFATIAFLTAACAAFGHAIASTHWGFAGFSMLNGFSVGLFIPIAYALIANRMSGSMRPVALIVIVLAGRIGYTLIAFTPLVSALGWRALYGVAGIVLALVGVAFWVGVRNSDSATAVSFAASQPYDQLAAVFGSGRSATAPMGAGHDSGVTNSYFRSIGPILLATLILFLLSMTIGFATVWTSIFLIRDGGMEAAQAGFFGAALSVGGIIGVLACLGLVTIGQRILPAAVAICAALTALACYLIGNSGIASVGQLIGVAGLFGFASSAVGTLIMAELPSLSPPASRAGGFYTVMTGPNWGMAIAALLGGFLASRFGADGALFTKMAIPALLAAPLSYILFVNYRRY